MRYLRISELIAELRDIHDRFGDTVVLYDRMVWGSLALHAKAEHDGTHECDLRPSPPEVLKARLVEYITDETAEKGSAVVECAFLYDNFAMFGSGNTADVAEEIASAAAAGWMFIDDRTRVQFNRPRLLERMRADVQTG